MSMHQTEARKALDDVAQTQKRARTLTGYRFASAHFMLWGAVLFLANGINHFMPGHLDGLGWMLMGPFGFVLAVIIGMRDEGRTTPDWRYPATMAAIAAFVFCALVILWPATQLQINAFISLLFGVLYVGAGIWYGVRYLIAGIVVSVLTLFAFFNLPDYFNLWMAFTYGGALMLTGLWMRRA